MPTTDIEDHNDIRLADGVTAYHGSPHEFEEFDPAFIGTGEGAQAYGHGLYFAENEDVAKQYRDSLGQPTPIVGGKDLFNISPSAAYTLIAHNGDIESAIEHHRTSEYGTPKIAETLESLRGQPVELRKGGHMYEVRIDAHPEKHLLDWDKPLSEQHPEVKKALKESHPNALTSVADNIFQMKDGMGRDRWFTASDDTIVGNPGGFASKADAEYAQKILNTEGPKTAGEWLKKLGSPQYQSEKLSKAGIRGIRYLDAGSRGQDEQSGLHNYVIFDPKHIKTVRHYAEGGGIKAFAFGNSVPHLEQASDMIETHDDIQLAPGVEPVSEMENEASSNQTSPYAKENDLLQPIGQSKMVGDEDMLFDDGLYKAGVSSHAWNNKKSIRYLHHDEDGNPIGALQIMTHGPRTKKATIQNVYVAEDHRRKNIAANLLKRARRDFDVKHSQDLTDQGRAFAKATKAYGGAIIPGPKLTEDNADDFARRLIAWTFATAPLFQRASGGSVIDDPLDVLSKLRR
jgi:GNAT superfamily N-acetyltransferase